MEMSALWQHRCQTGGLPQLRGTQTAPKTVQAADVTRWRQWRAAILGTLGAAGIWLAAIVATQPSVDPPPLPIAACGGNQWVTTAAYTARIDGVAVVVPSGFTNDLASIPPQAAKLFDIGRDHPAIRRGALAHDWLYHAKTVSRDRADLLLYRACLEDGMDADKARAVWEAVKLYGFIAWERSGG